MNDTEWYLIGGLIAAGVVILILLFLLFRRSSGAGSDGQSGAPGILGDDSLLTPEAYQRIRGTDEVLASGQSGVSYDQMVEEIGSDSDSQDYQ
jgi:hypothetical protein